LCETGIVGSRPFLWFTSKFSSMQNVQGFIQIAVI